MDGNQMVQIVLILAGFLGTFITLTVFVVKWMIKRIDMKDDRFTELSREDRDKFLEVTEVFKESSDMRAQAFYEMANKFDQTIREVSGNLNSTSANLETLIRQSDDWWKKMETIQQDNSRALGILTGDFMEMVEQQHLAIVENLEKLTEAMCKVCKALDIQANGRWDGKERRKTVHKPGGKDAVGHD